ncbi:MAG: hypothetical protein P8Z78_00125 [Gammaproteobacteria bacterium]|jgi:chromosome segregation ATPase
MSDGGFVDLRLNREGDDHNESFWPSFTDIMTVIVMIFLLAMIILLLKNTELVNRLQLTLEAERQATAEALEVGKAKEALEKQLADTRAIVATLQNSVDELIARSESQQQAITALETEKSGLILNRDNLQERLDSTNAELANATAQLQQQATRSDELATRLDRLQQQKAQVDQQLEASRGRLEATRDDLDRTTNELQATRTQLERMTVSNAQYRSQLEAMQQSRQQLESDNRQLADELQKRDIRISNLEEQQQKSDLLAANLREQIATTNDLLTEARAVAQQKDAALAEQQETIGALGDERSQLKRETERLRNQLETLTASISKLQGSLSGKEAELSEATSRLETLQQDYASRQQEIEEVRQRFTSSQQNLTELETEYDDLKQKYDKLFKPARTNQGKYIVEMRYTRQDGADGFLTKRPEDSAFRWLSVEDAESLLAESSRDHCSDLYVKVVFPQGENLSHSKAWSLTQRLHRYDYYFRQDECP